MNISEEIWDLKYRFKKPGGEPIDKTIDDTHWRVARALAEPEVNPEEWAEKFHSVLSDFSFLPAGRIVAGAGTGRRVTLFNCYVMGTIPDSMDGIFNSLREAALTMQQGGGIGYDFSTIRPKGAVVVHVGADASGPLPFMDAWDSMCRTVMSAGSRRGAMMATLRCDHPDVEAFIEAKKDPIKLRMFNVSVLCTDDFMVAVKNNELWDLVHSAPPNIGAPPRPDGKYLYKTIKARELWDRIMRATYDYAEPGVIFIDRINQLNNLSYCETIAATNPCGEQPLPPYGACLLGSINLTKFIGYAFSKRAQIDYGRLKQVVAVAVRMLDNAIDVSNFPLSQQAVEAKSKRRIGLGVTGLADLLMMMNIRYGSDEAVEVTEEIMRTISDAAYTASAMLAKEKGKFPLYDSDKYFSEDHYAMEVEFDCSITDGLRNSHLLSIAPTGTISLYAGNISSGIEPIFAPEYIRKVLQPDGSKRGMEVLDYAVKLWRDMGNSGLPPAFVDVNSLIPAEHLAMQAVAQKWVDTSISKTINLPEDIPFEDFQNVYLQAYNSGCKGCTTYRPNAVTGSVLSVKTEEPKELVELPQPRPDVLEGRTYKLKFGSMEHALYVTINDSEGKPFEIFLNSKDVAHQSWMAALSRMTSAVFRRGGDIDFVIEELKAIHDPIGGGYSSGKFIPSVQAAIGDLIERHLGGRRVMKDDGGHDIEVPMMGGLIQEPRRGALCPKCNQYMLIKKEGCDDCPNCGYNKCS